MAISINASSDFEKIGSAYVGGDKVGGARGARTLDISAYRTEAQQIAAGNDAVLVGNQNIVSGDGAQVFGSQNTAVAGGSTTIGRNNLTLGGGAIVIGNNLISSGQFSTTIGDTCLNNGLRSVVIGQQAYCQGDRSVMIGEGSNNGSDSIAIGNSSVGVGADRSIVIGNNNISNATDGVAMGRGCQANNIEAVCFGINVVGYASGAMEVGRWGNSDNRLSVIRFHPDGMVANTVANRDTAFNDGDEEPGEEPNGSLPRGQMAFRRDGLNLYIDFNDENGVVRTISIGAFT